LKNEESVIGRLLGCLMRLDYPVERFEVIIVDDGSVDGRPRFVGVPLRKLGIFGFCNAKFRMGRLML
jgi:cellulose synthase/poly-beta-1,6-N-acetylglucosamine synthase-like glycosyltransferase